MNSFLIIKSINKPKSSSGIKRNVNHNHLNNNLVRPNTTNIFNKNKNNTQRNFNLYPNSNNKIVSSFANGYDIGYVI